MPPTPQERISTEGRTFTGAHSENGDRIVITGMSGTFPQCKNIQDFSDLLYNKVAPESSPRYTLKHPEIVATEGTIPDLDAFDAQFFKVHYKLGNVMDPSARKVLEHTYQAIFDAGVNPVELFGRKIGVYIGASHIESDKTFFYNAGAKKNETSIMGCSKTMSANRVSYWLNGKGPSMSFDQACSSSTVALEQAYLAIESGQCEAAIVGGTSLCLHPQSAIHYSRLIKMSKDGKTKSFDVNADGCGKSEAISVLFLQKAKHARRIYGELIHAKVRFTALVEDVNGPKFGFYRNVLSVTDFINTFCEEAKICPHTVEYVEAFGCGSPEVDKQELKTIEKVYCKDRKDTLLVGSVMSNIGYSEASTGVTAITKVLLGYHTGKIAANHCPNPRQDIHALRDGSMSIVTEHQTFNRGLVAVNGLSFTGVNSHVLLHGNYKPKDIDKYKSNFPRLVAVFGRHVEAVQYMLDSLKSQPIDPEQIGLLHGIHHNNLALQVARGYTILDTNETNKTVSVGECVEYSDAKRPLWFLYSGMGSQWVGMGTQLLRIPIFAAAIQKCHNVLEPKGLNIIEIITSTDKTMFDNILHSFVGIAAIQIGLTDILHAIGLEPDGLIGHSVGEVGCAYADGCMTAEETILASYNRGLASTSTPLIKGTMAAVGLGYKQIINLCPPEIDVACHNSAESCTISGPAEVVKKFVVELTAQGVFAKEVETANIAYHSRYISEAGPILLSYLKDVIKTPKPRSKRWVSTSVPESEWDMPAAQICSAEYHTNNLLNPVFFDEASKHVPANAVLVEIAPHGLLQAILKRSMPSDVRNIPLTRRTHPDNVIVLLEAIGKLFIEGFNPKIDKLYPKIEYPVSTGTPFLSHLVKWAHGEKWNIALYNTVDRKIGSTCTYNFSYFDEEYTYLRGNVIRGQVLYPFAASLVLAWDTLAMVMGVPKKSISVKFTDLQLHSQPILHDRRNLKLNVALHRGSGMFEIYNEFSKVLTGSIIHVINATNLVSPSINNGIDKETDKMLLSKDIYHLLQDNGSMYSGDFQSLESTNTNFTSGKIRWSGNWVTFIDGLLQLNTLRQTKASIVVPSLIRNITIDIKLHKALTQLETSIPFKLSELYENTRCGGVTVECIEFEHLPPSIVGTKIALKESKSMNGGVRDNVTKISNYKLECAQLGDYESLQWVEVPEISSKDRPVTVHYVGLNMDDVKTANGSLLHRKHTEHSYGMDFSGISDNGERVMGVVPGAAQRRVVAGLCWPVPEYWSLEDAATVPLAYSLAYYCCVIKFKVKATDTVYVNGGCGALGQAVISLALAAGAKVLTDVKDPRKKHFLLRLFPKLKDENIGFSREPNFSDFVMSATNGNGCDLVISTAPSDVKHNALKVSAREGWTIDLTQIQDRSMFHMQMINIDLRNYLIINVPSLFENEEIVSELQSLICHGISSGVVRPLSRITYDAERVSDAFRLLAGSQHRGRVLLQLTDTLPKSLLNVSSNEPNNLAEQILKLAGIPISKDVDINMSLRELGSFNYRIPMISRFLRNSYNIAYNDDKICSLTINSLLQLEKELTMTPYEDPQGWWKFVKYIDDDELRATTDMVVLPTLNTSDSMRSDEFKEDTYLCIIPGIEGHHARFYNLCERLKVSALVLQPSIDCAHESVQVTARKLTQVLLEKAALKKNFLLLGYEIGVILALEMAAILEEQGMIGTVYCLGHSPYELKLVFEEFTANYPSQEELHNSLLRHMYGLMSGADGTDLVLSGSWNDKLEYTVKALLGRAPHTAQYMKILITAALNRVQEMQRYTCKKPARALRSNLVLMRAKSSHIDDKRHLQLHSLQKLSVYQMTAPLADLTMDLKCSPIINSHLSPDLLEAFANKNTCETYMRNENSFMLLD